MLININKNLLLDKLSQSIKIVDLKNINPAWTGIAIEITPDEVLFKSANETLNLKIKLESDKLEIKETGNILIRPKYVIDILRTMDDETITLSSYEDNLLKINGIKNEYILNMLDYNDFPMLGFRETGSFIEVNSVEFKKGINQTITSIYEWNQKIIFTGLNLRIESEKLTLTGTDTHRISSKEIFPTNILVEKNINVTIPYKTCLEFLKLAPDSGKIKIYFNDNYVSFIFEGIVFQTVLVEGIFPDVSKVFPNDFNTKIFVQNKTFTKLINRADISTEEEKNIKINLKFEGKTIFIKSHSITIGHFMEEFTDFTSKGLDEFNIIINSKYILDALKSFTTDGIEIQVNDAKKPIVVSSSEDESLKHVIMPVNAN